MLHPGWLCVAGGVSVHLVLGTLYLWGNITTAVTAHLRKYDPTVTYQQTLLVYATALGVQGCFMLFGGLLERRFGARKTVLLGGYILSLGTFLASTTTSLVEIMVYQGVFFGVGLGICYTAPITCAVKWLPHRKGFVTGCIVAGFGFGAFVFGLLSSSIVNPGNENLPETSSGRGYFPPDSDVPNRVPALFRTLAGCYVALVSFSGWCLREPTEAEEAEIRELAELAALHNSVSVGGGGAGHVQLLSINDSSVRSTITSSSGGGGGGSGASSHIPRDDDDMIGDTRHDSASSHAHAHAHAHGHGHGHGHAHSALSSSSSHASNPLFSFPPGGSYQTGLDDSEAPSSSTIAAAAAAAAAASSSGLKGPSSSSSSGGGGGIGGSGVGMGGAGMLGDPSMLSRAAYDVGPSELVHLPLAWHLSSCLILTTVGGMYLAGTFKTSGQEIFRSESFLSTVASFSSIFNAVGRIFWGGLADRFGPVQTAAVMALGFSIVIFTYPASPALGGEMGFALWTFLVFLFEGGNFALYPTICTQLFGVRNSGANYSVVFWLYSVCVVINITALSHSAVSFVTSCRAMGLLTFSGFVNLLLLQRHLGNVACKRHE